jgi:hypothetical protein
MLIADRLGMLIADLHHTLLCPHPPLCPSINRSSM